MNQAFDVVIVGNGAIGTYMACKFIEADPNLKVALVGPKDRRNSASTAAGAMANVFAETEKSYSMKGKLTSEKYLEMGVSGSVKWKKFLEKYDHDGNVMCARDTIVFLKDGASEFEKSNYQEMILKAKEYEVYEDISINEFSEMLPDATRILSATKIRGEFSMDTFHLMKTMELFLIRNHVTLLDQEVKEVISEESVCLLTDNSRIFSKRIVIAAGAVSQKILSGVPIVPMLQGVGSAFLFKTQQLDLPKIFSSNVIRTVNRGGAQCGFHVVPRRDGYYLGAGNYITFPGESDHRLETLRYLFQTLEFELIGKKVSYDLVGSMVKGHRPRSLDGVPLIGPLLSQPNIYIATGTNRAGLTWAPRIAEDALNWLLNSEVDQFFDFCRPERSLYSYGTEQEALDYFIESRLGAAIEHKLIDQSYNGTQARRTELHAVGIEMLKKSKISFSNKDFVPHPDHWAPIIESNSDCFGGYAI